MGWLQKVLGGGTGVSASAAKGLVDDGAVLLDVREQAEWDAGHAPEARHLPLATLSHRLDSVPRDRRVVVVCRSGRRSAQATALLSRSGVDAVNLTGGMQAWWASGLPVVGGGGRPGVVA